MNATKTMMTAALAATLALGAEATARKDWKMVPAANLLSPCAYTNAAGEAVNYRFGQPENTEPGKTYPLVLYFHGAGERGKDNLAHVRGAGGIEIPNFMKANKETCDGYFLAGQCVGGEQWVDTPWGAKDHRMPEKPSVKMALMLEVLEKTMADYPVDPERVYVTGLSMGGYGTWDAIQRRPELFAAALPCCGGGDRELADRIKDVPIWAFHGGADGVVPTVRTRIMAGALWELGSDMHYTEMPGVGHVCWNRAYQDWDEVLPWLFAQRLSARGGKAPKFPAEKLDIRKRGPKDGAEKWAAVSSVARPLVYTNETGATIPYRFAEPDEVKAGETYPLVVWLHGAGERGTNSGAVLCNGAQEIVNYMKHAAEAGAQPKFGADGYFLAAQCPNGQQWVDTPWGARDHRMPENPSKAMALLIELLKKTMAERPVDPKRVYVAGVSMGGYGTWDLVQRFPDLFAAAMPCCGGGDVQLAERLKGVPIWAFHGDRDGIVPFVRSRLMSAAIWRAGGNLRYTEFRGVGHNSWNPAYNDWDVRLKWLFEQRRTR